MHGIRGKNTGCLIGPLNKSGIIAKQAIFHTGLYGFGFIFQAVKVDMKENPFSAITIISILINDGKCRTANDIFYPFSITESMDKCGFARPHFAMKSENLCIAGDLQKLFGSGW